VAVVGRRPRGADKVSIEVEDLDARRIIDDVDPIPFDGDCTRAEKHTVVNPAAAPDQIGDTGRATTKRGYEQKWEEAEPAHDDAFSPEWKWVQRSRPPQE